MARGFVQPLTILFMTLISTASFAFWWWDDPMKPDQFKSQAHERLYQYYTQFNDVVEDGGWESLSESGDLAKKNEAFLSKLAKRLYLSQDIKTPRLPEEQRLKIVVLKTGLKSFQERHGLEATGELDQTTLQELNVPASQRLEQIKHTLNEWKKLPEELGKRHIMVNIPTYELNLFEEGEPKLSMKVIVGSEYDHETPVFSEDMKLIVFRPYWNIPRTIVKEELLPKILEDSAYLEKHRYEMIEQFGPDAEVLEASDENIARLQKGELNLRQRSGPGNALGLVKFLFPNKYAVYLHDTPADHLFAKKERDLSHGCVRVEKPAELAAYLMGKDSPHWTMDKIKQKMNTDERYAYALKTPVPVHLVYHTVGVQPQDGRLYFYQDIYRKAKLASTAQCQGC